MDKDIRDLPTYVVRALAKGRVSCLFGISSERIPDGKYTYSSSNDDGAAPIVVLDDKDDEVPDAERLIRDDEGGGSSSDSDAERSSHMMKIVQRGDDSSLCSITLEEYGEWKIKYS